MTVNTLGSESNRPSRTVAEWLWPFLCGCVSLFCVSALIYYHARQDVVEVRSPLQVAIASLYRLLGLAPGVMLCLLAASWSTIWLAVGTIDRPASRALRLLAMAVLLGVFLNLGDGGVAPAVHKGAVGAWLAERLVAAIGYVPSLVLVWAATFGSLLLATDFFFSDSFDALRRHAPADFGVEPAATEHLRGLAAFVGTAAQPASAAPDSMADVSPEVRADEWSAAAAPLRARGTGAVAAAWPDQQESEAQGEPEQRGAQRLTEVEHDERELGRLDQDEIDDELDQDELEREVLDPGEPALLPRSQVDAGGAAVTEAELEALGGEQLDRLSGAAEAGRDGEAESEAMGEIAAGREQGLAAPIPAAAAPAAADDDPDSGRVPPAANEGPLVSIPRPERPPAMPPRAPAPVREVAPQQQQSLFETAIDEQLVQEAIEVVVGSRRATAALLQRKLRIDYPLACRLLAELAARGKVAIDGDQTQGRVIEP